MAKKILFDTDPGIDDSMALILALRSPELDVVAITTVFGNTDVESTSLNALRLIEFEGRGDIPVAKGAARPYLRKEPHLGREVHGEDGMGNINLPLPKGRVIDKPAAQMIVDTIMAQPGEITLVAVGPLTNLGLALRLEPRIQQAVKEVVIMGGSAFHPGNVSQVAEANISNDPHAASLVFSADWPLTMVGLDVTTKTIMSAEYLERLKTSRDRTADLFARMLPIYQAFHDKAEGLGGATNTHDPSAIGFMIDPTLFVTRKIPMIVETEGHCAGYTAPDPDRKWSDSHEVTVCVDVDSPRLLQLMEKRLAG